MKIIIIALLVVINISKFATANGVAGYIKNSYLPSDRYSKADCRELPYFVPFDIKHYSFDGYSVIVVESRMCRDFDERSSQAFITSEDGLIVKKIDVGSTDLRFIKTPDDFPYLVFDGYHQSGSYAESHYYFYTFAKKGSPNYPSVKLRKTLYQVKQYDPKDKDFAFDMFYKDERGKYSLDTNIVKKEDLGKANAYQRYEVETFSFSDGGIYSTSY
jgi:hypothetical protein